MNLRPYQIAAVDAVLRQWQDHRSTLLVLPTGTGKTIVFSRIIERCVEAGYNVLILAHREELLNQAADKLRRTTGLECALEKAESSSLDSFFNVTVGSVQTIQSEKRLKRFAKNHFDAIVIDEAHHAVSPSYRAVINYFDQAKILGVTATADRGDKRNLGEVFETLAYDYPLISAIRDGYLCPIKAQTIPLRIDLNGVKVQSGDYQAASLGSALEPYLDQIAQIIARDYSARKTVVFLPLIATSQKMCSLLQKYGLSAAEVNGESEDRAEILADFHSGKYSVLCNSMLLTEGWDEPAVDCIVCLRPTKVRALYAQIVGRGTRLSPGKDHLLILDFLWQTEKHDLCRPAHLVCQNEDLVDRIAEILAEQKNQEEPGDLLDLVAGAESDAVKEREENLRKQLEEQRTKQRKLVDPLQFEASITGKAAQYVPDPADLHAMLPPTAKQIAALEKNGINPDSITCQGHASKLLDTLSVRRYAGLSSPKQIRVLERFAFQQVGQWSWQEANKMISRIAANAWHIPSAVNPRTYQPEQSNEN